jgi:membrane associated rhomboid family serine protease
MKRFYNVYLILIGLNVFMFLLQSLIGDSFTRSLLLVPGDVLAKPWTLLSSMFLHGSVGHLFFNMYALLIFGGLIEQRIGSRNFLASYLFAGIFAGSIYSIFSTTPALGASGAIMAVLGLAIMLLPDLRVLFFFVIPMSLRTAGIIFALIDIFGLFNPGSGIAHLAHLGGLFIGLVYGYYLVKQKNKFYKKFTRPSPKVKKSFGKKDTIEMSDEDIDEFIKNGRL